jgi:molybdopterin molybdotransferase
MIDLLTAQQRLWQVIQTIGSELAPRSQCVGRYLTRDLDAPIDLPVFDNSSMDGYGVNAADLQAATSEHPQCLRLSGRIIAGEAPSDPLPAGACWRIFTGAAVPSGVTAVVAQETVQIDSQDPSRIWFRTAPDVGENIRRQGTDIRRGTQVLKAGIRLTPPSVFLLASLGIAQVQVGRRPVVGLVVTGNELSAGGVPLEPGKIYDSNRAGLAALISQAGGLPRQYPLVGDQLPGTRQALAQALAECDAVVSSGGVSVGDTDFVKDALISLGGRIEFWRVSIKPGMPFLLGAWQGKWLLGLPGNPASAWMTFAALAGPALARMQGAVDWPIRRIGGQLRERITNSSDRCLLCRIALGAGGLIGSAGGQASHVLSSASQTHGWIEIPPHSSLEAGTEVLVNLLE